jgi:hypothetical protein
MGIVVFVQQTQERFQMEDTSEQNKSSISDRDDNLAAVIPSIFEI